MHVEILPQIVISMQNASQLAIHTRASVKMVFMEMDADVWVGYLGAL